MQIFLYVYLIILFLIIHTYILYPLIIFIISKLFKPIKEKYNKKSVSILISAYNEEKVIGKRIENLAGLQFDFSKLEVLIGSDNSSDRTNLILDEYSEKYPWLHIKVFKQRRGKAAVLNDLVGFAKNEILIFTDANTMFENNSVKKIVSMFVDERIGGVCGRLVLKEFHKNKIESSGEIIYWKYETMIKKAEGRCGILIGANGGIFAVKKKLFNNIPVRKPVTDDLYLTLSVIAAGKKFIYNFDAVGYEKTTPDLLNEYNRKVRFAATNYQTVLNFPGLIFRFSLITFALISHKIIRWLMPLLLLLFLVLNYVIVDLSKVYEIILYLQLLFYLGGIIGYFISLLKTRYQFLSIIYYFLLSNYALLEGLIRFLRGKHSAVWNSTPR